MSEALPKYLSFDYSLGLDWTVFPRLLQRGCLMGLEAYGEQLPDPAILAEQKD